MSDLDFTAVDAAMQAWRDALDALTAARGASPAEWWELEQAVDDARRVWEKAVADAARTRTSFAESADGHRIDHYPAAPVPADPARADTIEYRAELTVDGIDGALVHLASGRDRTGWTDCGEPLRPVAARSLAATLVRLADLADRPRWTHAAITDTDVVLCRIDTPGVWEDVTALEPCDLDADALIGLHGYRMAGPWETIVQGDGTEYNLAPVMLLE